MAAALAGAHPSQPVLIHSSSAADQIGQVNQRATFNDTASAREGRFTAKLLTTLPLNFY